jgi:hypothetical protein
MKMLSIVVSMIIVVVVGIIGAETLSGATVANTEGSTNWAGYSVRHYQTNAVYTEVQGSWRVPQVKIGPSIVQTDVQNLAIWVGRHSSGRLSKLLE